MGYPVAQFVSSIDENLLCGVCGGVLQEPVLTSCGHSFCRECLEAWLDRPSPTSCPECRADVLRGDVHPILCVRNFVLSLLVTCPNVDRGCQATIQLERLTNHVCNECAFGDVTCDNFETSIDRNDESKKCEMEQDSPLLTTTDVTNGEFFSRVTNFNKHLVAVQSDLDTVLMTNTKLERDIQKTRQVLDRKHVTVADVVNTESVYSCAYSHEGVHELTSLISRNLTTKPINIAADRLFNAIVTCNRNFAHSSRNTRSDVIALLTIACASNWFTPKQNRTLTDILHESF